MSEKSEIRIPPCFDVALSDQFFGWIFALGIGVGKLEKSSKM